MAATSASFRANSVGLSKASDWARATARTSSRQLSGKMEVCVKRSIMLRALLSRKA